MGLKLFERAGRFVDAALGLLGNRLSLFGLELQEELERLLAYLAGLFALLILAGLALLCASAALLIFASQQGWLLQASLILAGAYALLALLCAYRLWRSISRAPVPFAATRAEFERDRASLNARRESET